MQLITALLGSTRWHTEATRRTQARHTRYNVYRTLCTSRRVHPTSDRIPAAYSLIPSAVLGPAYLYAIIQSSWHSRLQISCGSSFGVKQKWWVSSCFLVSTLYQLCNFIRNIQVPPRHYDFCPLVLGLYKSKLTQHKPFCPQLSRNANNYTQVYWEGSWVPC